MLLIKQNRFLPPVLTAPPLLSLALGTQWGSASGPGTNTITNGGRTATVTAATKNTDATSTMVMSAARVITGKWYVEFELAHSDLPLNRIGLISAPGAATYVSIDPYNYLIETATGGTIVTTPFPEGTGGIGLHGRPGGDGVAVNYNSNGGIAAIALDMVTQQVWYRPTPITPWSGMRAGDGDPADGLYGISIVGLVVPVGLFVATYGGTFTATLRSGGNSRAMIGDVPVGFTPGWPVTSD